MRVLIFSDLHAHNFEQFATTLPGGRNSRLQNILNVLDEIKRFCVDRKVDLVFFLGDLFHSRTKVDVDVFSATWTAVREICNSVKRAYIMMGNHDSYNKVGSVHSLEPFREFATVVDQPIIERYGECRFAMHPFTTDIAQWHAFVEMLPKGLDFFFFHQGLSEAVTGAFDISIKAEVAYADLPLQKAAWCLGGHYHKAQNLGAGGRAGYIGSPLQHNMGERTEDKSFVFFDGLDRPFQRIPTKAPRFYLYEDQQKLYDDVIAKKVDPNVDFVRVRCTESDACHWKDEYPRIQVEIEREEQFEERRIDPEALTSDLTLLKTYIEQASVNGLNADRLLSLGLELLSEE